MSIERLTKDFSEHRKEFSQHMKDDQDIFVKITDSLNDLKLSMSTIIAKQETHDDKLESIDTRVKLTNGRVTKLEKWQWLVIGGASALTVIWTVVTFAIPLLIN